MAEVYRTENKINGKFYYGVHEGNNDNYLGSGTALQSSISKYGRENFKRRTIIEFDTAKEAYDFEALIVDQDFVDRNDCYNISLGGKGGFSALFLSNRKSGNKIDWTDKKKKELSIKMIGEGNNRFGTTHTEDTKQKMRDKRIGTRHSKKTKNKMRESALKRWSR